MFNFHKCLHTMYTYVPNSVVKISMMFAKYFEHYTIILRGPFFRGQAVCVCSVKIIHGHLQLLRIFEFQ